MVFGLVASSIEVGMQSACSHFAWLWAKTKTHALILAYIEGEHVHARERARVHACMRACVHACVRACVHACMYAFVCVSVHICVCDYVWIAHRTRSSCWIARRTRIKRRTFPRYHYDAFASAPLRCRKSLKHGIVFVAFDANLCFPLFWETPIFQIYKCA